LNQFLLEAFLISGFGSVLGILIAVAIPLIARRGSPRMSALRCHGISGPGVSRFLFGWRFFLAICRRRAHRNCNPPNLCDMNKRVAIRSAVKLPRRK